MEDQVSIASIEDLLPILEDPIVVIDIGCRWGVQEHWKGFGKQVQLFGIDADNQEIKLLETEKESGDFTPVVLGANQGSANFYMTRDPACSSLYPPDEDLIRIYPILDVTALDSIKRVEITTLDTWAKENGKLKVDFIKLDVQGAELDVLRGAQELLSDVRMLELEVQFNPIYKGVPLFGDVDRFLREHGFSLWRLRNQSHYELSAGTKNYKVKETNYYDSDPVNFDGRNGQLFFADAFYVQNQIVKDTHRPWEAALRDACIGKILGFDDLAESCLSIALTSCPPEITWQIKNTNPSESTGSILSSLLSEAELARVEMTASCSDSSPIPKVPQAGAVLEGDQGRYQLMHNGVKVIENGYCGQWMTELIKRLNGHHEPQEEKAFFEILKHIPENSTMLELGSYWSYYSLWFKKQISNAKTYLVEPDPNYLAVGEQNFDLNEMQGIFLHAAISNQSKDAIPFQCDSDHQIRQVPAITVDDLVAAEGIDSIELLQCDIQGFELEMLQGSRQCLEQGLIRFIVLSTHHHTISNDPLIHQKCLDFLQERGAHILAEHTIAESFSGDGLIAASFRPEDRNLPEIKLSRNISSRSLFREIEYDLEDAWNEIGRLKAEIEMMEIEKEQIFQQLDSMYTSRSFQVTAPLRKLAAMFRKLTKR